MATTGTSADKGNRFILFDTSTFAARITLNHAPYNVLTVPMMNEIAEAIESLNGRGDVKCIVLDSSQKMFSAGISLEQMAGDWGVVRGSGKTVCTITLTNAAAGGDAFALKLKPGCDAFVTRFGPAAWYMDRGELVLKSSRAGQFWRFEANDPTNWQRVPETREPINLVRQQ